MSAPKGPNTNDTSGEGVDAGRLRAPVVSVDWITATTNNIQMANFAKAPKDSTVRPEVQNAMRALREMPPYVREREIETGRYSHFSPEERELLRSVK